LGWHVKRFNQYLKPELETRIKEHEAFLKTCLAGDFDLAAKLLQEARIEINAPLVTRGDGVLVPSLIDACTKGNQALVKWLLDAGANPNVHMSADSDKWSSPPLFKAIFNKNFNPAIVEMLLKVGADINAKNNYGQHWIMTYPLQLASEPYLRRLVECGLDINFSLVDLRYFTDDFAQMQTALTYYGYDVNWEDAYSSLDADREAALEHLQKIRKLRDEAFAEMVKEDLLKEESLKKMSADVIGLIASYVPTLSTLKPAQRIELAKRCYAKTR
jgi:hypothetical protein